MNPSDVSDWNKLEIAILALMDELKEGSIFDVVFAEASFPGISGEIWRELSRHRMIAESGSPETWRLTGFGWSLGLKLESQYATPDMMQRLTRLCHAIKAEAEQRHPVIAVEEVAKRSGLAVAFVQNVVDANMIVDLLQVSGPTWAEPGRTISVPADFGA
jgi:hypothetical protein